MTIQFQLTESDFREASAAVLDTQARKRGSPWTLLYIPLFSGVGYYVVQASTAAGLSLRESLFNLLIPSITAVLIGMVITIVRNIRVGRAPSWRIFVSIGTLILIGGELLLANVISTPVQNGSAVAPVSSILLPHLMWIALLLATMVITIQKQFSTARANWVGQRSLQYPRSIDISAFGITSHDALIRQDFQWQAFVKFEETRNLFLLFTGPQNFLMIPKRAFIFPDEMIALRELAKLIDARTPSGFPVGPPPSATPSAPIPLPPAIG